MVRVSKEEIERIKAKISLKGIVERSGVELKQIGSDLHGCCPFHEDRTPSLVITPAKNLWHCLGACQAGGSVIDWVMRAEKVSYRHALVLLKEQSSFLVAQPPGAEKRAEAKYADELSHQDGDEQLMARVVEFYSATLKKDAEALAYLKKRGLTHPDVIEHFKLGFANRTLAYKLPPKSRADGAALRSRLQELGVLRKSGHEHFNGSLVIPLFDEEGHVAEMYGRKVSTGLRKGTPKHLYLPGPHRGVLNGAQLVDLCMAGSEKELLLCESLIDALTFWCAGFQNVTASFGVEGFTKGLRELVLGCKIERVFIAYDRDEAGDAAALKLAEELSALGVECLRVLFPKGMDANEYARKVTPAEKSLKTVLEAAEPMLTVTKPGRVESEQVSTRSVSPPPKSPQATKESIDEGDKLAEVEKLPHQGEQTPCLAAPGKSASREIAYDPESDEAQMSCSDRRWRVRGLAKNTSPGILRINLFIAGKEGFFVDNLDLYSARHRAAFVKNAASEVGVEERALKGDLGRVLLSLEELQERLHTEAQKAQNKRVELSDQEQAEALALLKSPELLKRIEGDFDKCGLVGERTNKLLAYLGATSRKLEQPLAIVVQSSSAAGKSSLMDAVLRMIPEEERVQYSAMTGQSLFYMGETNLSHKVLAIAEEEGASQASYALKLLQSEGELRIASTGKDPATGRLVTQEYRVEGPVMMFLTTTALEVDEELLNRCLVLTVDESREQTQAIHERQRHAQTLEGLLKHQERSRLMHLHQNAQRLIRPLLVANPFAEELSFCDGQTRTRRDHMKYLTLIKTIALLHQYQREVKTVQHQGAQVRYIEVTQKDIAIADKLSADVLQNSEDQLPPKTRELLTRLSQMVHQEAGKQGVNTADVRFTRRQLRETTQLGDTQLKMHLARLVEMELLSVQRERHAQRFVYSLLWQTGPDEMQAPVGAGRVPVGATNRPVLSNDSSNLTVPVGGREESQERGRRNGASYMPVERQHSSTPISLAAAAEAAGAAE